MAGASTENERGSETTDVEPLIAIASQYVTNFSIGFARFPNHDGNQDVLPAGSGALVSIGSVSGILTAAHVLNELPDHGKVGLISFTPSPRLQRLMIDMEYTEKLAIGGDGNPNANEPNSPDIGFLRLPARDVETLKATTNAFFNLTTRRKSILEKKYPTGGHFDGVAGIIAEWTSDQFEERDNYSLKGFKGLFGVGCVQKLYELGDVDLVDFEVSYDASTKSPGSYKGISGSALWRIYVGKNASGSFEVAAKHIFGTAFHQSPIVDNKRTITCHGPRSVYGKLYDAVQERWGVT